MKPKISIIIYSYNFDKYLSDCIESVLSQTLTPHEIIICDDHSTDCSWDIICKAKRRNPNLIKTYRHKKNIGMTANGNFGFKQISGNLISWIDGDDKWKPEKLEVEWKALESNPNARISYSNVTIIDNKGIRKQIWDNGNNPKPPTGDGFVQVYSRKFFPNSNSVFRNHLMYSSVFKEIGYFDENLEIFIDWDFKIRAAAITQIVYTGKKVVEYRIHKKGISNSPKEVIFRDMKRVYEKNLHLTDKLKWPEKNKIRYYIEKELKTLIPTEKIDLKIYNETKRLDEYKISETGCKTNEKIESRDKIDSSLEQKNWFGENLIFLISQPRAGSTLLQRILSGNSEIYTTAEPWIMLHPLYALKQNGLIAEYDSNLAWQGMEDYISQIPEGIELYFNALRNLGKTLYERSIELSGKVYFLDKTPRYHFIIPELTKVFPKAKFIILFRNPMAVLSSVLKTWFANEPARLHKSPHLSDLLNGPIHLLKGIEILKSNAIVVRYEELVEDPEITVKSICCRLGITYERDMLNYGSKQAPKGRFGDTVGIDRHKRVVPDYKEKWLQNLQSKRLYDFSNKYMETLGPVIFDTMGYPFVNMRKKLFEAYKRTTRDSQYDHQIAHCLEKYSYPIEDKDDRIQEDQIKQSANEKKPPSKRTPFISVITPSLNQAQFIERTIQSVLEQNYSDFEHIIVDGGSSDNTIAKIKKYKHILWISEKDRGQSHALNKGLKRAKGEIIAWLNADDWYEANAFARVSEFFNNNPDKNVVMGNCNLVNEKGEVFDVVINKKRGKKELQKYWIGKSIPTQPAVFFRRKLLDKYGYVDENLNLAMDYDLWMRFVKDNEFYHIDETIANYRFHENAKGGDQNWQKFIPEWKKVYERYAGKKRCSPEVSVIIPCYNHGKYLGEAIESVIAQSFQEFEIIIVNDGSTDNTQEIAEKLVNGHPHHSVRLINQENSGQPAIARNNGIAVAKGEYILPLDADDKLHPQAIENYMNRLNENDDSPIVIFGWLQSFGTDDSLWTASEFVPRQMLLRNQIPASSLFHRSVWELQKGYRTNVPGFEDWDFWIGAIRIGAKFLNVRQVTTYYRKTTDVSLIDRGIRSHEWNFANIVMNNREMYEDSEIQWAKNYLAVHSAPPKKREMHGPQDPFPLVGAMLVSSHPERYTESEIAWANSHLEKQPSWTAETGYDQKVGLKAQCDRELPITAIIATYNESDIIYHVIKDYVEQNINVYLIDNHSTDSTVAVASKWLGKGLIRIEKFPSESNQQVNKDIYSWRYILQRKEQVAIELGEGWYIHADADEFREAPWYEMNLRQGIERVDKEGYNAINFKIYDFKPTMNNFQPGDDVRKYLKYYDPDIHEFNNIQIKCWKYSGQEFSMWPSGGHSVEFDNRRVYPIPFVLRHYSIRSQRHGLKKVFKDRKARFDQEERAAKWHDQYDEIQDSSYNFLKGESELVYYSRRKVCHQILKKHNKKPTGVNGYYEFLRPEIQNMIDKRSAKILDVGCASGRMAAAIKQKYGAEVWGIEIADEIASRAAEKLDKVISGDINKALSQLPEAYFDTIIFADVLEHMENPYAILEKMKSKLSVGGCVIASIPNVQHWSVLKDLIEGKWDYKDSGILDRTHLRFFTKKTVQEMFQNAGFKIIEAKATILGEQSIPKNVIESLSEAGLDVSHLENDSQHYQYIVKAAPLEVGKVNHASSKLVSIIILTLNQLEYTERCLKSIFQHTRVPFELIIVDNGSIDKTIEFIESEVIPDHQNINIRLIKNSDNKGFALGNNQGMEAAKGAFFLLMNNDIVVTPGWLERLLNCAERSPKIGIVGPMSNNVSGPQLIQNIGYNLETLEGLERYSENLSIEKAEKSQQILRVVGFCMLIKRAVINKIGGMDHRYGFGNFEDDDFSIRAAIAGFESWMVENCFVHHFGSRTFIGEKIDYRKSLLKNWKIFIEKWGLPDDLPYGSSYIISQMKVNSFDPKYHYIPLSINDENQITHSFENTVTVEQEYSLVSSNIDIKEINIAIEKLQRFAIKYKNFAPVYNDLGILYYKSGDHKSALEHYQIALNNDQSNISFRKNLADLLAVEFAEYEEALRHYVTVLASDPKDVEALLATGHICARLERYDDASEFYEKVLETEPHNSDAQNWLAKLREKSPAKSLEVDLNHRYLTLLSKIDQEDLAGAIQKVENFIDMYPKHGQAHNDLGVLYYKNQSKAEVLAHYLKAVELEPENVTYRKNLADFLYVEEGRVEEALENYVEVLRIKPDDVETLLITGHICTAIERYEDAMSFYNKVLNLEPQNLDARQNMEVLERRQISMLNQEAKREKNPGDKTEVNQADPHASVDEVPIVPNGVVEELMNKADLLFQQERNDQAVDTLLKAIGVNPSDGTTYIELARQLVSHGWHEKALEVLSEMPLNQPEALATQKLLLEGYGQEGMGNYAAAKKCSDSVLDREPENAKALNLNGILAYRNDDKATAEQHFKRVIELDSEYGEPHTNLGALVWETSEPKIALEHYERGFSISPTDIDVANAYHKAVTATGEYKGAEKAARSALKKYPQCRKVLYLLVDTLIRQEKNEEALKELETALSTFGIDEGLLDTALALRERVWKIKKTGSAKNPGVSLCMIVKDEEANLARCLASVKPIVDEMVVVDTGSTDRTRDIAEFFGARVYEFEWGGDFAEARNFSLSKAKGDWIFIMDADEIISPQDYKRFRKLTAKKPSELRAYSIITRNYSNMANTIGWIPNTGQYKSEESGLGWLSSEKVRLFSNNSEIKFEGAVHEMVDPVLKRQSIRIKKCPISVHHYGRLNTGKLTRKDQTYFEIGRNKLLRNGGDIGAVRELAVQATVLEKNSEAIELWQKFLSMGPGKPEVSDAYVNMVSAYIRMQDYDNALKLAQKAVSISPQMKEAQYNLGIAELYNGNPGTAFKTFNKLAQRHPDFPPAQFLLAASNYCRKNTADMNGNIKKLKQSAFGPALTYSVAELAEGLITANHHKLAFKLLQNAIKDEIISKSIFGLYTDCLEKIKEPNKESDMIFEKDDTLSESISECNLK